MERSGVTHRILEAGPQVLHGIVELPLLAQGPKDKALDVLRQVDTGSRSEGGGGQGEVKWSREVKAGQPRFQGTACLLHEHFTCLSLSHFRTSGLKLGEKSAYRVGAGRGEVKGWHLDLESEWGAGRGDKSVLDLGLPLVTRVLGPEWEKGAEPR